MSPKFNSFTAILIFHLFLWSCIVHAQTLSIPVEEYGVRFVQAINTVDKSEQEKLIRQLFSPQAINTAGMEKLADLFSRLHADFSPLVYHHTELTEFPQPGGAIRRSIHVYAKKAEDTMWSDFQLILESQSPHLIQSLAFIAEVTEPIYLPNGSIDQGMTLDWLKKYMDRLYSEYDLFGAVLIAKGNDILFEKYTGYADGSRTVPISENTLFSLASGGKMFTAMGIARLVEQNKLRFDSQLRDYFPDFPNREYASMVTVHHLLSHSSGISEFWTKNNEPRMMQFTRQEQFLPLIYQEGFSEKPGTEFHYSNSNYLLLGLIIEKVSGKDFYDFVRENITRPAGMQQTDYYFSNDLQAGLATPLTRDGSGGWTPARHGARGSSAGGAYSNCREMLKFSQALKKNFYVTQGTFKSMISIQTSGLKDAMEYGYGFILSGNAGLFSYGHGGIASGMNFEYRYFPETDITFIIFSNQDNGAFDDLKKNTLRLITGER